MDRLTGLGNFIQHRLNADNRLISLGEIILVIALAIVLADMVAGAIGSDPQGGPINVDQSRGINQLADTTDPMDYTSPSPSVLKLFGIATSTASIDDSSFDNEQIQETQLQLELKGILVNADDGKRLALIAVQGQSEDVYQEGDNIQGAEIIRIEPRRVILRHNGRTEALNLEIRDLENTSAAQRPRLRPGRSVSGIRRVNDRERIIPRETFNRQLNNLPRLLQQARAIPHNENGQAMGFRLVNIQSGSVFEELGLQRDDVIRTVNGRQILSVEDALNTYRDLRTSRSFQVGLMRDGRQVTLSLSVQ